jgi:hypothetical protein
MREGRRCICTFVLAHSPNSQLENKYLRYSLNVKITPYKVPHSVILVVAFKLRHQTGIVFYFDSFAFLSFCFV